MNRPPATALHWECVLAPSPRHAMLAEFVRHTYASWFGARLDVVMPELCALLGPDDEPHAVAGFRHAADDRLFLEQYLDIPIETAIMTATGADAKRVEIWEVGNLATRCPGAARDFVATAARQLASRGAGWAVFTGTRRVVAIFRRLGIPLLTRAPATPDRVAGGGDGWGDYYEHTPRVLLGRISAGLGVLAAAEPGPR
jgi:hypothetical protein